MDTRASRPNNEFETNFDESVSRAMSELAVDDSDLAESAPHHTPPFSQQRCYEALHLTNHLLHKLGIQPTAGLRDEGSHHQVIADDGFNIRSFESAKYDGREKLENPALGTLAAERLLDISGSDELSIAYDNKSTNIAASDGRPKVSFVIRDTQRTGLGFLWGTLSAVRGASIFIPLPREPRMWMQTKTGPSWAGLQPGLPGPLLPLAVRHSHMDEFRQRLREYCKKLHLPDDQRQRLQIPYSGVELPLSYRPTLVPADTGAWPEHKSTQKGSGAAAEAFRFWHREIKRSACAQLHGIQFDLAPYQPLGGDGNIVHDGGSKSLDELKWGRVSESHETVRFVDWNDPSPQGRLRYSAWHPLRSHHYSTWFSAEKSRDGMPKYLYHIPCSAYRIDWWSDTGELELPRNEVADYRVAIDSGKDWFAEVHAIMQKHGFTPARPYSQDEVDIATISNAYGAAALVAASNMQKDDEGDEEDDDLEEAGLSIQHVEMTEIERIVFEANEIAAYRGYGVFLNTGVRAGHLPQILFYGIHWQPEHQQVYYSGSRTLPVSPHPGSMPPNAPVVPIRHASFAAEGQLAGEIAWPRYVVPSGFDIDNKQLFHVPSRPGLLLVTLPRKRQAGRICAGGLASALVIPDELIQRMELAEWTNNRLQTFMDYDVHGFQIRRPQDFYDALVGLQRARKSEERVVSWYKGEKIVLRNSCLTNMKMIWQEISDHYTPSIFTGNVLEAEVESEDDDSEDSAGGGKAKSTQKASKQVLKGGVISVEMDEEDIEDDDWETTRRGATRAKSKKSASAKQIIKGGVLSVKEGSTARGDGVQDEDEDEGPVVPPRWNEKARHVVMISSDHDSDGSSF